MPMVLLCVVVLEEIAAYEVRKHVHEPYLRTLAILIFFGVGFVLATSVLTPRLKTLFTRVRRTSTRSGGTLGLWLFYAAVYGALFAAFYIMETRGVAGLLPASLR